MDIYPSLLTAHLAAHAVYGIQATYPRQVLPYRPGEALVLPFQIQVCTRTRARTCTRARTHACMHAEAVGRASRARG